MHLKSAVEERKTMASLNDDDGSGSRAYSSSSINIHNNNNNNSSNNNNNVNGDVDSSVATTTTISSTTATTTGSITAATPAAGGQGDEGELKVKRQTLEQRKNELERLLSEKSWLLQQIQKQETQILNGNYEYLNLNDIFANLAQQYKLEQQQATSSAGAGDVGGSAILRRKLPVVSKDQQTNSSIGNNIGNCNNNNTNNNNNRQSEISNRSSEYDNYPGSGGGGGGSICGSMDTEHGGGSGGGGSGSGGGGAVQQYPAKNAHKKRATPTPTAAVAAANLSYLQLQRQQQQQHQAQQQQLLQMQHLEQQLLQKQQQLHAEQQQHLLQQHLKYVAAQQHHQQQHHQQQQQKQHLHYQSKLHPHQRHYQQQQQQQQQTDAISLYSANSANVATLRQQHVSPQQPQPIVVQCDKYYLSPTHQSYGDGGFIKSSQNIKKYVSPQASPTQLPSHAVLYHQHQHLASSQQSRQLDAISLAPSYASVDADLAHNLRWRSHSNIPNASAGHVHHHPHSQDGKSHSSDMLAQFTSPSNASATASSFGVGTNAVALASSVSVSALSTTSMSYYSAHAGPPPTLPKAVPSSKPLDEISISSLNSDTHKKPKSKQWLESSLDGPVIRTQSVVESHTLDATVAQLATGAAAVARLPPPHKTHGGAAAVARERAKLSSQSMSSGRHYSMSAQKSGGAAHTGPKLLQDDDGRYAKLSQSTSYLNTMETAAYGANISPAAYHLDPDIAAFRYLPPKPNAISGTTAQPIPPPRPPPAASSLVASATVSVSGSPATPTASSTSSGTALAPDIRIESPKNMTVVQQATFQPYKEVTKPFEMSDFYKYSTKFRQKESVGGPGDPSAP